jgi:hypothetical protein
MGDRIASSTIPRHDSPVAGRASLHSNAAKQGGTKEATQPPEWGAAAIEKNLGAQVERSCISSNSEGRLRFFLRRSKSVWGKFIHFNGRSSHESVQQYLES